MIIFELRSGKEAAFNLTESEMIDMSLDHGGDLSEQICEAIECKNIWMLYKILKEFILRSYGVRYGLDDPIFIKNSLSTSEFAVSRDFEEVLNAILRHENVTVRFIEGIMSEKTLRVRRKKS